MNHKKNKNHKLHEDEGMKNSFITICAMKSEKIFSEAYPSLPNSKCSGNIRNVLEIIKNDILFFSLIDPYRIGPNQ